MKLRPIVASTGKSAGAVRQVLDERALEMVAQVAGAPAESTALYPALCAELIEMHVFREREGQIWLDTAVFLEEDIQKANRFAQEFGDALANLVIPAAEPLLCAPPIVRNFLVGIIAIGQSLHQTMKADGLAVDWLRYGGRYAGSKVDFEEVCEAAHLLEPDLHNKGMERGLRYTAFLIGPGGSGYYLKPSEIAGLEKREYIFVLDRFLTDAYPLLLTGQLDHPDLREAAEKVGLVRDGQPEPVVITNQNIQPYLPALDQIAQIVKSFYYSKLDSIHNLLYATTSGRQGVPDRNMTMHLWRYLRRAICRAMYARSFFTDPLPETKLITVFFENDVEYLNQILTGPG
ncbi:MAG: hypothetical protein ACM3PY_14105 [Omnitrophica WOR_2 bacterium]